MIAWTGGSIPTPEIKKDPEFRQIRHEIFRDYLTINIDYWDRIPPQVCRILWNRANLDAWATIRKQRNLN